jgi:hypothetical protein
MERAAVFAPWGKPQALATAAENLHGTRASKLTVGFDCRGADLSGDGDADGLDVLRRGASWF